MTSCRPDDLHYYKSLNSVLRSKNVLLTVQLLEAKSLLQEVLHKTTLPSRTHKAIKKFLEESSEES